MTLITIITRSMTLVFGRRKSSGRKGGRSIGWVHFIWYDDRHGFKIDFFFFWHRKQERNKSGSQTWRKFINQSGFLFKSQCGKIFRLVITLTWSQSWFYNFAIVLVQIPAWKKVWKPKWVEIQVPAWKDISVPDWKKIHKPIWVPYKKEAWKEIQVSFFCWFRFILISEG